MACSEIKMSKKRRGKDNGFPTVFLESVSEYEEKENQLETLAALLHYVYTWADLYDRKQLYATLRNAAGI